MATIRVGDEVSVTSSGAVGTVTDSNGHAFKVSGVWSHAADLVPGRVSPPASGDLAADLPSSGTALVAEAKIEKQAYIDSKATTRTVHVPSSANVPTSGALGPTVYICNAEDCAFIGSGAAVAEIEELFAEASCPVRVQYTECIKGCGQGVNIRIERTDGEDGMQIGVNSFQRCAEVALDAQIPKSRQEISTEEQVGGFKAKMLRTRSNNMRWAALKTATKYGQDGSVAEKAVSDAEKAEYGAARAEDAAREDGSTPSMDRAKRRWQRLREAAARSADRPAPTKSDEPQARATA